MTLRAIRVWAKMGQSQPERYELGPDLEAAILRARADAPVVLLICEEDAGRLESCRHLLIDRGRKHPAKPLASLLLGHDRIPFIRGGHTSPGQLLRSLRTLLVRAMEEGDANLFLIGASGAAFEEVWARSEDTTAGRQDGRTAGNTVEAGSPLPAGRPAVLPSSRTLFSLLAELPVPDSVRERFIGESEETRLVLQLILRAAAQEDPVLILGDTGTGKEVVARLIHDQSSRRLQSFTAVNCGAIPRELLESELFGYEKGSHSTATARKTGLWQRADRGTLFLDEIADLSLDHQVKILRALEHGEITPVGAERDIKVDARVIAATNRDLFGMMQAGEFREDLYYRLRSFMIRTPALRDHPTDIPGLATHFWRSITRDGTAELPQDILAELAWYRWPGNARELRMVLSSLYALFGAEPLTARHLQAVFEFEGQAGGSGMRPPAVGEVELHRVECLRQLRRAGEVLRAAQVALRPLRGGGGSAANDPQLLAVLVQRVSELELLCLRPLFFHGKPAFAAVRRVKDRLRDLAGAPPTDPDRVREAVAGLDQDFSLALTTIFDEMNQLLAATGSR